MIAPPVRADAAKIDADALAAIRSLELRAQLVVQGFLAGLHRSPYHGFSVEFSEHREYVDGDDVRHLDWQVLARSDRLYVRRYEDETNVNCWFLVDHSASMAYRGAAAPWAKWDYAATLTGTLAYFLAKQRDAAGLMLFDDAPRLALPPRYRPGWTRRILLSLEDSPVGRASDVCGSLRAAAEHIHRRGLVVLISDLLCDVDDFRRDMALLRSRGQEASVFRILDRDEVEFPFDRPQLFRDPESGRQLHADPGVIRKAYVEKFEQHESQIAAACRELDVGYHRWMSDQPLNDVLSTFLRLRADRGKVVVRRQPAGGNR